MCKSKLTCTNKQKLSNWVEGVSLYTMGVRIIQATSSSMFFSTPFNASNRRATPIRKVWKNLQKSFRQTEEEGECRKKLTSE